MKYLYKLSNEKLVDFLNKNGLFLLDSIEEQLEGFDKDRENSYYLRCYSSNQNTNSTANQLKEYIGSKLPNMRLNIGGYLNSPIDLFILDDFSIQRLFIDEEITQFDIDLQHNYHNMMLNEFSSTDEYISDYNNYVSSLEEEM